MCCALSLPSSLLLPEGCQGSCNHLSWKWTKGIFSSPESIFVNILGVTSCLKLSQVGSNSLNECTTFQWCIKLPLIAAWCLLSKGFSEEHRNCPVFIQELSQIGGGRSQVILWAEEREVPHGGSPFYIFYHQHASYNREKRIVKSIITYIENILKWVLCPSLAKFSCFSYLFLLCGSQSIIIFILSILDFFCLYFLSVSWDSFLSLQWLA